MPDPRVLRPLVTLLVCVAPATAQIAWSNLSVADALAQARKERRVVAIAVNMDGERANDELVADHYKDPRFARLSARTINLFASAAQHGDRCPRAPGVTCAQHNAVEQTVREKWLQQDANGYVIAPQHLFLDPDGKVLLSVPYSVTKGELEWLWVEAIHRLDADFLWELAPDAHAPGRLEVAAVKAPTREDRPPPTPKEVADIVVRMKKGMPIPELIANIQLLVRSPEEAAQKQIKQILGNAFVPDEQRGALLHQIGRVAPPVWWDEVLPYLGYKESERVRREAAVALEQLGEKKASEPLLQRFAQESADPVKGEILRALGRTAGANKKATALLQEVLTKARPKPFAEELRLQAILATVALEDRVVAVALIQAALKDPAVKVRSAALYSLATRREKTLLPVLKAGLPGEQDAQLLADLAAAIAVLEGGDGKYFADYLKRVGDVIPRDRR